MTRIRYSGIRGRPLHKIPDGFHNVICRVRESWYSAQPEARRTEHPITVYWATDSLE